MATLETELETASYKQEMSDNSGRRYVQGEPVFEEVLTGHTANKLTIIYHLIHRNEVICSARRAAARFDFDSTRECESWTITDGSELIIFDVLFCYRDVIVKRFSLPSAHALWARLLSLILDLSIVLGMSLLNRCKGTWGCWSD